MPKTRGSRAGCCRHQSHCACLIPDVVYGLLLALILYVSARRDQYRHGYPDRVHAKKAIQVPKSVYQADEHIHSHCQFAQRVVTFNHWDTGDSRARR